MKFTTGNESIKKSFDWAEKRALSYVYEGYAAGPCYDAALPDRKGFCMRDMSHQSVGGHYLGLDRHNRNMIFRFAENISEGKDYCTYWEITRDNIPYIDDYTDDQHFWYNLPANFDILRTCAELYELTGDPFYFTDPEIVKFIELTVTEYIKKWDRDGDGLIDRVDTDHNRGICSYDEGDKHGYRYAGDTFGLQATAYRCAAKMYAMRGDFDEAKKYADMAKAIEVRIIPEWWMGDHLAPFILQDGKPGGTFTMTKAVYPIRDGQITGEYLAKHAEFMANNWRHMNIEEWTYIAEAMWLTGRDADALEVIKLMTADDCARRDYPEVSYTTVADVVRGYMGIVPEFSKGKITTRFGGIGGEDAEIADVPVWGGFVDVKHHGKNETVIVNRTGHDIIWEAHVGDAVKVIKVADGETAAAKA